MALLLLGREENLITNRAKELVYLTAVNVARILARKFLATLAAHVHNASTVAVARHGAAAAGRKWGQWWRRRHFESSRFGNNKYFVFC